MWKLKNGKETGEAFKENVVSWHLAKNPTNFLLSYRGGLPSSRWPRRRFCSLIWVLQVNTILLVGKMSLKKIKFRKLTWQTVFQTCTVDFWINISWDDGMASTQARWTQKSSSDYYTSIYLSIYLSTHYITVSKQIIDFRILLHTLSHLKSHSYH